MKYFISFVATYYYQGDRGHTFANDCISLENSITYNDIERFEKDMESKYPSNHNVSVKVLNIINM